MIDVSFSASKSKKSKKGVFLGPMVSQSVLIDLPDGRTDRQMDRQMVGKMKGRMVRHDLLYSCLVASVKGYLEDIDFQSDCAEFQGIFF